MTPIHAYELPESFVRRFRPVVVSPRDMGLPRVLFDGPALQFFRSSATPDRIPNATVWSITEGNGRDIVVRPGLWSDARGFLVTEVVTTDDRCYPLTRRLSYRQKVQRATLFG